MGPPRSPVCWQCQLDLRSNICRPRPARGLCRWGSLCCLLASFSAVTAAQGQKSVSSSWPPRHLISMYNCFQSASQSRPCHARWMCRPPGGNFLWGRGSSPIYSHPASSAARCPARWRARPFVVRCLIGCSISEAYPSASESLLEILPLWRCMVR